MSNRPPFPEENPPAPRQRLTEDEYRVLRECNQESFFQRCLPMGIGSMLATQVLVNKGIWKPHPKYGSLLKLAGAGLVGYIVGKASYQQKCRDKILRLENSPLADAFRQQRPDLLPDMRARPAYNEGPRVIPPPHPSELHKPPVLSQGDDDFIPTGSINDEQNRELSGLSDHLRPSIDGEVSHADHSMSPSLSGSYQEQGGAGGSSGISYADLQARNRERYAASTATAMPRPHPQPPITSEHAPFPSSQPPTAQESPAPVKRVRRNQFGDIIED